jgi:uncharacterized protein (TIGR02453 family)
MYSKASLQFFKGIKKNPNKIWYEKNKENYKKTYVAESAELMQRLAQSPEFQILGLRGSIKTSLFRLHRDVRFSKDKSLYKTWNGFVMSRSGQNKNDEGVFYLHMQPGQCFVAVGFWEPDPKLLASMRRWIVEHPEAYESLEAKLKSRKLKFDEEHSLRRLPQGFKSVCDKNLQAALKRRHFIISKALSDEDMTSVNLVSKLRSFVKKTAPLLLWGWSIEQGLETS